MYILLKYIIYSIKTKKAVVSNREKAGRPLGPDGIKKDNKKGSNRSSQPQPEPWERRTNGGEETGELPPTEE